VARAKEIAITMLAQQERTVDDEVNRYTTEFTPVEGTSTAEVEGLQNADRELQAVSQDLKALQQEIIELESTLPPGAAPGSPSQIPSQGRIEEIKSLQTQLRAKNEHMKSELQRWGSQYPILLDRNYTPGAFANRSPAQVSKMTGVWLQQIKDDIAETKGNITGEDIKVWDLHHVPAMTFQSLGVSNDSLLGKAVNEYIQGKKSDAQALETAISVLQVATIVAAAAAGGPAGAALMSAGWGVFDLVRDIDKYLQEKAAENVALDPALRDISALEPSLIPIALDLISLGLDIKAVPAIVKSLKGSLTALRSGRKAAKEFIEEAASAGLSREQAERLAKRYGARAPDLGEITKVAKAIGDSARHANLDEVLDEIAKYAKEDIVDFLKSLRNEGKIVIIPANLEESTEVLIKTLGEDEAHNVVQGGLLKAGGFYDPYTGIIFAKQSSFGFMQGTIMHEAVHALQDRFGKSYQGFVAEFQAFVAQRNYLLKIAKDMPVESLPELGWLVNASDADIISFIEHNPLYRHAKPDNFDVQDTVIDLWDTLASSGKLGIPVNR
ncbi:MAG: hypothetical protein MUO76_16970, partial [Anaerolineaceae bacterium]|nr:hypothetical protein [Anaerolineaceae bacterium]